MLAGVGSQDSAMKCSFNAKHYFALCLYYKPLQSQLDIRSNMAELLNRELLYQEFGITLANQRRRQHLSQAQFGAKVGLSRTSVTNIECGRQPIQLHQLYLFAWTLKVDVTKLLPKESVLLEVAAQQSDDKQVRYLAEAVKMLGRAEKHSVEGGDGG